MAKREKERRRARQNCARAQQCGVYRAQRHDPGRELWDSPVFTAKFPYRHTSGRRILMGCAQGRLKTKVDVR